MKRRDCCFLLSGFALAAGIAGCTVAWEDQQAPVKRSLSGGAETGGPAGRRRSNSQAGPTDLKTLSKLLQQAGYPLEESQIEYLLKLREGPEFMAGYKEVLNSRQKQAITENTSGRRRGGGRRR